MVEVVQEVLLIDGRVFISPQGNSQASIGINQDKYWMSQIVTEMFTIFFYKARCVIPSCLFSLIEKE